MRAVVLWCLLTGGCMLFGWPNHWILAAAAFAAGILARAVSERGDPPRRAGYIVEPSAERGGLTRRIEGYTSPRWRGEP